MKDGIVSFEIRRIEQSIIMYFAANPYFGKIEKFLYLNPQSKFCNPQSLLRFSGCGCGRFCFFGLYFSLLNERFRFALSLLDFKL